MSDLRCAVVGVGYLGRFHAQKYQQIEGVKLIGVCDASAERSKQVADELKVEAFNDYKQLVGKVDAVTVASNGLSPRYTAGWILAVDLWVRRRWR